MFADYKANRREPPEEFKGQVALVQGGAATALRIPSLEVEGYEADDVIATLTRGRWRRASRSTSSPATATPSSSWATG